MWVLFLGYGILAAQQQRPPTLGPPPDQQPPTLGGSASPAGPHAANTTDARKLTRIHAIFIESMDNDLAQKLADQIGSNGPFKVVTDKHQADALLRGTCFDDARLKIVHSEVFLTALDGASIWQDIVRQPYKPPPLARAVATTAEVIADDLDASLREAQDK
jgi:hypothetical protein